MPSRDCIPPTLPNKTRINRTHSVKNRKSRQKSRHIAPHPVSTRTHSDGGHAVMECTSMPRPPRIAQRRIWVSRGHYSSEEGKIRGRKTTGAGQEDDLTGHLWERDFCHSGILVSEDQEPTSRTSTLSRSQHVCEAMRNIQSKTTSVPSSNSILIYFLQRKNRRSWYRSDRGIRIVANGALKVHRALGSRTQIFKLAQTNLI